MTELIDKPVIAQRVRETGSVAGSYPAKYQLGGGYDYSSARKEQIRRARLIAGAFGRSRFHPLTPEVIVSRLAQYLPGLRYQVGLVVVAALAPNLPGTVAPKGNPPGPQKGIRRVWTDRAALAAIRLISIRKIELNDRSQARALESLRRAERKGQADADIPIKWAEIDATRLSKLKSRFIEVRTPFLALAAEQCPREPEWVHDALAWIWLAETQGIGSE